MRRSPTGRSKYRLTNGNGDSKESPWDRANFLSKYSLFFMLPLLRKGYSSQIDLDDIGSPPRVDLSRTLGLRLQHHYNQELINKRHPSFLRAMLKTFGPQLFLLSILDLVSRCFAYPMQTVALGWLIRDAGLYLVPTAAANAAPPADTANGTATPTALVDPTLALDEAYWRIVYDAILLLLFSSLAITLSHPYFLQTFHMGMKCRVAACFMIYKKSLRLSQSAMSETTVGQMVNLLSNDVNRFDQAVQMFPYTILAPLQAIIVIAILSIFYLGFYATLASLVVILIYVAIQTSMGRGFSKFRSKTAKRTDERVRLMNEIILAMRIIKMYAWEGPFKKLVHAARKREITTIGIASILKAINQTLFFVSSKIIVFVALITYVLLGYQVTPEIVFVTIGLANLVRISLTLFFPNAVAYTAETIISCRRINNFLMLPEIEISPLNYKASSDGYGCKHAITMKKVFASWAAKDQDVVASADSRWAIIRDLSLAVKAKDLVLIVGRVGSGKSSVLMSLLGELPIISGQVVMNGSISFASQESWIFSGTVRDNILFGKTFDADRYNEVLRVCSLERDIEILIEGDSTIVGERGVSLSGGQKARVNLARALYYDADIYLLDDPLSAVDAPVAKHIFNESLRTFLRKKTVVLATHQLQFLRHATKVLVLDRDLPAAYGTLQEVMESEAFANVNYSKEAFEDASTTDAATDDDDRQYRRTVRRQHSRSSEASSGSQPARRISDHISDPNDLVEPTDRLIRADSQASSNLNKSVRVIESLGSDKPRSVSDVADDAPAEQKAMKKRLEAGAGAGAGSDRRKGTEALGTISSDFSTYFYYLRNACGPIMFVMFLLTNLLAQSVYQYTDFFLSFWTDSVQRKDVQGAAFVELTYVDKLTLGQISSVYGTLVALCFFFTFCRSASFFVGTLRASINIHDKMFRSIIHAPMTFFDFSPIGILLNRLSRDIGFIDETLPATAIEIVTILVNISGIIVVTVILDYKNIAASIVLVLLAFALRNFAARTITRLKQIEGVTRSPIFSHLSTTLSGLATVRAFKVQEEFVRMFDRHQDSHSSAWFNYICSGRWLTVAMDWLCQAFVAVVISLLLTVSLDGTNASLVGLLISQIVVLPGPFQWLMRQLIEAESQMTSVQRVKEFSELAPESELMGAKKADSLQEMSDRLLSFQAGQLNGLAGEIHFRQVSLSYFEDEPPVLKALSFSIGAGEKIGIVGRTGAGKSSIVSVLFRLYDFQGTVEIGDRSSKEMSLAELRRSMSIIPQDPILFGGTIRRNLDPFNDYTDDQLWAALEAVQLKPLFARYTQGLEFVISEGGANFSVGQRQLICLARAIVRNNNILVLDEATANVDPETDSFIQRTIAQQFARCTVLTIAHRLITIVDSDRVLVLERGQVKELAEPGELLKNESSLFAQMVNSSGQQAPRLRKLIGEAQARRLAAAKAD